jgi:hypothetical protein
VIPGQRVADKGERLVGDDLEELLRVEPREVAPVRLPAPFEVTQVRPAVEQAVLVAVDVVARCVGVLRQVRVRHPLSAEDVALVGGRRRRHLRREVEGRCEIGVAQVRCELVHVAGEDDDDREEDGGCGGDGEVDARNHGSSPRATSSTLTKWIVPSVAFGVCC